MKTLTTRTLAVVALLLLTLASATSAPPATGATEEFQLDAGSGQGFLVRAGLPTCPAGFACVAAVDEPVGPGWEPRTLSVSDTGFTGYVSNEIEITSRNGYSGTVMLEVLNLPRGVISQTATFVNVSAGNSISTPFMLQAAADAALGNHLVTVRATSDTHTSVQESTFTISIVDHLPPPPTS